MPEPEYVLYCDLDGIFVGLEEVMADGLERDYADRFDDLRALLANGAPVHRLHACVMLAGWGVREGFLTAAEWARAPEDVPWAGAPVSLDRMFGVDDAFARLAYGLDTARSVELAPVRSRLRVSATRALLSAYHRVFFDRSMALLLELDRQLAEATQQDIDRAVVRAIEAARSPQSFDMAMQAAVLLGPLAALDDDRAAGLSDELARVARDRPRALRELAYALGSGTGPATLFRLKELAGSSEPAVAREAREWLERRGAHPPAHVRPDLRCGPCG